MLKMLRGLLLVLGALCVVYLGLTAYLGYRVGAAIQDAERHVVIRTGAHLIGRANMELYAVHRSGIPAFLVESPTFWLLMRRTE
jgi:hypothetical protein